MGYLVWIFWALVLGVALYAAITLIASNSVQEKDSVSSRLSEISAIRTLQASDDSQFRSLRQRVFEPVIQRFSEFFGRMVPRDEAQVADLESRMRIAGVSGSASNYMGRQIVFMIVGCVVGALLGFTMGNALYIVLGALIGAFAVFTLMRFSLSSRVSKHKEQMEANMPDVLDLLSACVSAGLGFDQALAHVIEHMDGPLVEEFEAVTREMQLGKERTDALRDMAIRCDVNPLTTFVNAVCQADKLGIPIANVLQTQAEAIRQYRRQAVEEKAAKLPVKILIPLVLFIFPALLVVLLGPAALSIVQAFS